MGSLESRRSLKVGGQGIADKPAALPMQDMLKLLVLLVGLLGLPYVYLLNILDIYHTMFNHEVNGFFGFLYFMCPKVRKFCFITQAHYSVDQ